MYLFNLQFQNDTILHVLIQSSVSKRHNTTRTYSIYRFKTTHCYTYLFNLMFQNDTMLHELIQASVLKTTHCYTYLFNLQFQNDTLLHELIQSSVSKRHNALIDLARQFQV
jgi:hypothetical protein